MTTRSNGRRAYEALQSCKAWFQLLYPSGWDQLLMHRFGTFWNPHPEIILTKQWAPECRWPISIDFQLISRRINYQGQALPFHCLLQSFVKEFNCFSIRLWHEKRWDTGIRSSRTFVERRRKSGGFVFWHLSVLDDVYVEEERPSFNFAQITKRKGTDASL